MAKLKQYLENSWYRWASQDRQTWYAAQYQYGYGVNTRDMKNWVCLAWWATDDEWFTSTSSFHYFSVGSYLYALTSWWEVKDAATRETKCTLPAKTWMWADAAIQFWPMVYLFYWDKIYAANQNTFTYTDVTPQWWYAGIWLTSKPINYANTFLLFWSMWELWRMELILWVPTFKVIRAFSSWYMVYWLAQEWNYLKIYTTNRKDTKIHYAKWTFDVEDTWLIQTITINWLSLPIATWISSDLWNDYALFITWNDRSVDEYKLCKVQWYNVIDIRHTETFWWQKIFSSNERQPMVMAANWVVFASMDDWIWTFTEYNWWLRWWCCEFPKWEWEKVYDMYMYEEQLYACVYDWTKYFQRHYDMHFHPSTYQPSWYIIGRVFDWWCAWLFKKNDQATITYNMPVWTSMELSYRYDRDTFTYDKSNFLSIKKLTDVNSCYDIVVPTTPWQKDIDLLALENWDNILLENWNNILLEDLMVCPFNKTWNLLEYRFDLSTEDNTKTPILFEHSLTYYDYMRKYR
jgi:hypothetical protein